MKKFEKALYNIGEKLGNEKHLQAISNGMMMIMPLVVVGALFLIVANPPINPELVDPATAGWFTTFLLNWKTWSVANYAYLTAPFDLTMGLFGLMSSFTIAYAFAKTVKLKVNHVITGLTAMAMFLLVCVVPIEDGLLNMSYLGADGVFTAIIIALITAEIFHFIQERNWVLTFPDSVPPMVTDFVNSILPVVISMTLLYGVNLCFIFFFGSSFPAFIMTILTPGIDVVNNIWVYSLICIFSNLLWLIGINGTSIVFPILFMIGINNTGINAEVVSSGAGTFNYMNLQIFRFMILGGAGNTLGLVILMMFSKSVQLKSIGRLSFIPGICSINEPVIFGGPVVFNPVLAIPFLAMPVISVLLGYYAQVFGLIFPGYIVDPSFTPFFVQAYLSSLDWRNVVFVFVLVAISVVVYYPFFKIHEKRTLELEGTEIIEAE